MKPQFILAVTNEFCLQYGLQQGFNELDVYEFLKAAQSHLVIRQREHLDNCENPGHDYRGDRDYRQLLPYGIVSTQKDNATKYYVYLRTTKVGEERLAGNSSIGFGGHVDLDGVVVTDSVIDSERTVMDCLFREINEELSFYDYGTIKIEAFLDRRAPSQTYTPTFTVKPVGIIYDDSNDVGKLHLALVFALDVHHQVKVEIGEEELQLLPEQYTAEELLNANLNPESWTSILCESLRTPKAIG